VLSARVYRNGAFTYYDGNVPITDVMADAFMWLDVIDPEEADLAQVRSICGISEMALHEADRRAARPTLQRYEGYVYMVAFSEKMAEIDLFVGPTWAVTVRRHDLLGREWTSEEARRRFERFAVSHATPGAFVYILFDELIDGYFDHTDRAEDAIEDLEDMIFAQTPGQERQIQRQLFDIRRDLVLFRRVVVPLREVISALLRREVEWIDDQALIHLQDTHDHLLRAIDLIDSQRELLGNATESQLAMISNRVNDVMKKLTAWGSIVFGATLIAGIYGMNFTHMPELSWTLGYPLALGMMLVLSLVLYRMFRRRGWL
jgi:magnesium transporter